MFAGFAGYILLRFKDGREICQINPSQTLMILHYLNIFYLYKDAHP